MSRHRVALIVSLSLVALLGFRASSSPSCVPIEPAAFLCHADEQCTACTFDTAPASSADCYCPFCPHAPMTTDECDHNVRAWERHCNPSAWPEGQNCPVADCMVPPPVVCDDAGACVAAPELQCEEDADCTVCTYGTAPRGPDDCYCPMCPYLPMSHAECERNRMAWERHCSPQAWPEGYPCPIPMCVQPPPVRCMPWGGVCLPVEDGAPDARGST